VRHDSYSDLLSKFSLFLNIQPLYLDKIVKYCKEKLGIEMDQTSSDGLFTLKEVECLGACVNAPIVQINDDFAEDLTSDNFIKILEDLKDGKSFKVGSQIGRQCSASEK
jgi:hypothetical protein